MEKEVTIGNKTIKVKEMSYLDVVEFDEKDKRSSIKAMLKNSTDLSDEDIEKLSVKDGLELQKVVNEVNNLGNFSTPTG